MERGGGQLLRFRTTLHPHSDSTHLPTSHQAHNVRGTANPLNTNHEHNRKCNISINTFNSTFTRLSVFYIINRLINLGRSS